MKKDHISVALPIQSGETTTEGTTNRKSFRRYWNQLSRLQRNIILSTIIAIFITLLILLPGDSVTYETNNNNNNNKNPNHERHIQITPLKNANKLNQNNGKIITPKPLRPMLADVGSPEIKSNHLDQVDEPPRNDTIAAAEKPIEYVVYKSFRGPTNERQMAVVDAFKHAWRGYKEYAWGHDNLKPISMSSYDWFGLGLTIIDSVDTIFIMNLQEEYLDAREWVKEYLKFDIDRDVNLFEVTIRVLGGLLSAHSLTGDPMFKQKAHDLGHQLLPCFDSPSGIPYSDINLATLNAHSPKWSPDSSTSEVTTIQLEFNELSRILNDESFANAVSKVSQHIHALEKKDGLVPIFINANTGTFRNFATISLGARGDSYYEYLLKQWLQSGKTIDYLIDDYKTAIDGVVKNLVRKTPNEGHIYIGELINGKDFKPKMDHLTCYLPGTLLLGFMNGLPASHFNLAVDLLETCYQMYMRQPTQLAPEIVYFNLNGESESDIYVKTNDAHNLLRPEFVESLYYFYSLTGNKTYQDMGWTVFNAFEKYTKVKNGYTSIGNVKNVLTTRPRDMMESFFLGETLKYFYLLFSDDRKEIDLDKMIFNSEAHVFPVNNKHKHK